MKLRTFTGVEKECTCACGCNQKIIARPDVLVVVDMDSPKWRRDRYLPGHAGNGYGSTNYAQRAKKEEAAKPAPTPAPAAPAGPTAQAPSPPTPEPQADPAPVPTPKVVTGTAPSLADNRPWKILQVTISVGDYTSVKAGVADFGKENESLTQLGTRLVAELTNDIKTELDVVHRVQEGKPLPVSTQGVATAAPATPYPAKAGAPKGVVGPEMAETRRQIGVELECDASAVRSAKKRKAAAQWLKIHGYDTFEQVLPTDLVALRGLLSEFEQINTASDSPCRSLHEPAFHPAESDMVSSR